jgi:antitoxin ParD1/3/4
MDIFGMIKRHANQEILMGMNINLTPQLEEMVRQKVDSGLYGSASEVVREALRLMDEKDQLRTAKLGVCLG